MRDSNDIPFTSFSADFFGFLDLVFRTLFQGGGGSDISGEIMTKASQWPQSIIALLSDIWSVIVVIGWLLSALLIYLLIYAFIKDGKLAEIETQRILDQEKLYNQLYRGIATNKRWDDVTYHISTDNPNDWKLAIIEADVMLGDMLEDIGYAGTTIGEKLKSASPTSFKTLDQAWRAHRIRNEVAHGGADFVLTKKKAQETITQYKMVFEEFGLI